MPTAATTATAATTRHADAGGAAPAGPPREMAMPGTHRKVVEILEEIAPPAQGPRALDIGAGEGGLSKRLLDAGYQPAACDLYPEMFRCEGVECRGVDAATGRFPYDDESFDIAAAVELVEHLDGHTTLFSEVARVLRPGGLFLFSTPNILSLKSRWRYLLTGYYYSFGSLDPAVYDPVSQHIAPFTIDRYRFILARCGLTLEDVRTDKWQRTSVMWGWLRPLIALASRRAHGDSDRVRQQNCPNALFGRKLIGVARKPR